MYTLEQLNSFSEDEFYMILEYQFLYLDISELTKNQLTCKLLSISTTNNINKEGE